MRDRTVIIDWVGMDRRNAMLAKLYARRPPDAGFISREAADLDFASVVRTVAFCCFFVLLLLL